LAISTQAKLERLDDAYDALVVKIKSKKRKIRKARKQQMAQTKERSAYPQNTNQKRRKFTPDVVW
jgi:hypothetical protein